MFARLLFLSFIIFTITQCNLVSSNFCGQTIKHYPANEATFSQGKWPWMVALMQKTNQEYFPTFICGGVLISTSKVLTAAHCIQNKGDVATKSTRDIFLKLGAFNLNDNNEHGTILTSPSKIAMHPDWNPNSEEYEADIAVLITERHIPFHDFIQPICLPLRSLTETEGYVTGWGKSRDPTKSYNEIPKQVHVEIHSNEYCYITKPEFSNIATSTTFCAGSPDENQGPCLGDSGGGLYVNVHGTFYLKGLVSATLAFDGQCDQTNYVLYTNVEGFLSWIKNVN